MPPVIETVNNNFKQFYYSRCFTEPGIDDNKLKRDQQRPLCIMGTRILKTISTYLLQ